MRLAAAMVGVCALFGCAQPGSAAASLGFKSFSFEPSSTQAGGHPDLSIDVGLEGLEPGDAARRLSLDWPEGLDVVPGAVPTCPAAALAARECFVDSQVGVATIREAGEEEEIVLGTVPVFAVTPEPESLARIGFMVPVAEQPVIGEYTLRGAAYRTRLDLADFPQNAPLAGLELKLWGVPADPAHDTARFPKGSEGCLGETGTSCIAGPEPSNVPDDPQLESPTRCAGRLPANALLSTYEERLYAAEAEYPATTGCDQLAFNPSLATALTTSEVRSPTGLNLDLRDPQFEYPTAPSPTELRGASLHFEDGVLLGFGPETMTACGDAEAGIATEAPANCPAASELGTAIVDSPLLPAAIPGEVYYRGEDAAGSYLALLVASGHGVELKLPFVLEEDPQTGIATVVLEELPQLPISELKLELFSQTELLETVNECGEFQTRTEFVPWDESLPTESARTEFTLDSGPGGTPCPGPAVHVGVRLSPPNISVASGSTTKATAHITDANGGPAAWDMVEFRSSDPGERIGPVSEPEDGVYVATISSPTVAGDVTITAIDRSVQPNISGSATLHQLGRLGPEPPPLPPGSPKITRHPHRRTRDRRPLFAFTSTPAGATFRCSLDHEPFRPCRSPLHLPRLKPGRHRFRVVAVAADGRRGKPASFRFKVLKRPGRN